MIKRGSTSFYDIHEYTREFIGFDELGDRHARPGWWDWHVVNEGCFGDSEATDLLVHLLKLRQVMYCISLVPMKNKGGVVEDYWYLPPVDYREEGRLFKREDMLMHFDFGYLYNGICERVGFKMRDEGSWIRKNEKLEWLNGAQIGRFTKRAKMPELEDLADNFVPERFRPGFILYTGNLPEDIEDRTTKFWTGMIWQEKCGKIFDSETYDYWDAGCSYDLIWNLSEADNRLYHLFITDNCCNFTEDSQRYIAKKLAMKGPVTQGWQILFPGYIPTPCYEGWLMSDPLLEARTMTYEEA